MERYKFLTLQLARHFMPSRKEDELMDKPSPPLTISEKNHRTKWQEIQTLITYTTMLLVVLMGLFPPWVTHISRHGNHYTIDLGYAFIATPPLRLGNSGSVDLSRLFVQYIAALTMGGCSYWFCRKQKEKRPEPAD